MNRHNHENETAQPSSLHPEKLGLQKEVQPIPQIHTGLFLGAYNPIHTGHLRTALHAAQELNLKNMAFVPSNIHAFGKKMEPLDHRKAMIRAGITEIQPLRPETRFHVADLETTFNVTSGKTIEVLEGLEKLGALEARQYAIILGIDNIIRFQEWDQFQDILDKVPVVFMGRPGITVTPEMVLPNMFFVEGFDENKDEYRSTLVRELVTNGELHQLCNIISQAVLQYIQTNDLYNSTR